MREKKCKSCGEKFKPQRPLQLVCSALCGYNYSHDLKQKKSKEETKKLKEKLVTKSDVLKATQIVFNAWIRKRDENLPCISCGTFNGKMNAGHYRSVGSCPELRFDENNVHKQCERCNSHLSGNLINYRKGLIARYSEIGRAHV